MSKRKKIALFVLKFFTSYFVLFFLYSYYLSVTQKKSPDFECAPITRAVASHTSALLNGLGYHVTTVQHSEELSIKLLLNDVYTARVIEGCNSISLILLFVSFIIAFRGSLKATLLYAVFGSIAIYIVNFLRIGFLTVALYKYPHQQELLHNLVFPSIIYGMVFLLWVVWVQLFSDYSKSKI